MRIFDQSYTIHTPIFIFIGIMSVLFFVKPKSMFRPNGAMRELGFSRAHATLCPFWLVSLGMALLIFLYMYKGKGRAVL